MDQGYIFHIDAFTPETMPMARLAEYLRCYAQLLGHAHAVHFDGLAAGSIRLLTRIAHEAAPKVRRRLADVRRQEGDPAALRAFAEIDVMLAADNASGAIFTAADDGAGAEIIAFPGVKRQRATVLGPFNQEGSLDGVLVSITGADRTVHLQLVNGETKHTGVETDRSLARRLGQHLFEPVRVFGTGRWLRDEDGGWQLRRFRVERFEALRDEPLVDAVAALRATAGNGWSALEDPLSELALLRDAAEQP